MLKSLLGRNHPEFKTSHQQDAVEYFQHVLDFIDTFENENEERFSSQMRTHGLFSFEFEDRIECVESKKVKYVKRADVMVQLQIPLTLEESAEQDSKRQKVENEDTVIPTVSLQACLDRTFGDEIIDDF